MDDEFLFARSSPLRRAVLILIVIAMVGGTIWYLSQGIVEFHSEAPVKLTVKPTISKVPDAHVASAALKEYTNPAKGYSFSYPANWMVEEREGFLNSTHIHPPEREFEIIFSEGKMPYDFGREKTRAVSMTLEVAGQPYTVSEIAVGQRQKLIDFTIQHPDHSIYVLIRSTTEYGGDPTRNIYVYEKNKKQIEAVMASVQYLSLKTSIAPEGWEEFNDLGFRLFYPADMKISKQTGSEVVWGEHAMILRSSSEEYPTLAPKSVVFEDIETNTSMTVDEIVEKAKEKVGPVNILRYTYTCTTECGYQLAHFSTGPTSYELLFDGTSDADKARFEGIVSAMKFE